MANEEHLDRLAEGVEAWNRWREANPDIRPDLSGAALPGAIFNWPRTNLEWADLRGVNFSRADLSEAQLSWTDLRGADLSGANLIAAELNVADLRGLDLRSGVFTRADLRQADLSGANLIAANFVDADLREANLTQADLRGANFYGANLSQANFSRANLSGTDMPYIGAAITPAATLIEAVLVQTNFEGANLIGCAIYGISAWGVKVDDATQQSGLIISQADEPIITVDDLEVAQFINLLRNNSKIRNVIETITSKAVLILGRFTPERKAVLNAIREELRKRDRLPIVFDFTPPTGPTLLETVSTLAHMARFVIADLTDAKSILQELTAIVPYRPTLVVQPIILASQEEPGMWDFFRRFPWVLEPYRYHSLDEVRASLEDKIVAPAALKAEELLGQ